MSLSYRKRQLLKEAVTQYKQAKEYTGHWETNLYTRLKRLGWNSSHPGAEKYVAIKGPLVVKWEGNCGWYPDSRPIKNEMRMYRLLRRAGFGANTPKVYLYLGDFIVEQNVGHDYYSCCGKIRDLWKKIRDQANLDILDLGGTNVVWFQGKIKIIDGRVRRYEMP